MSRFLSLSLYFFSSPPLPPTEIIRVGDNKKVHHIDLIGQEQLLAVISGRNRHVRLFPTQALDGRETDSFKLPETKGCQALVSGPVRGGSVTCLCVAMKRQVICYEVSGGRGSVGTGCSLQVVLGFKWGSHSDLLNLFSFSVDALVTFPLSSFFSPAHF